MNNEHRLCQLPELLDTAASLLEHLGAVTGLGACLYPTLPEGIHLLVQTGLSYTDKGLLGQIGAALNAPITHSDTEYLSRSHLHGQWTGIPVKAIHYHNRHYSQPCVQPASEVGRRVRALIPWARQDWAEQADSVHVYDENGIPCIHVVLTPNGPLNDVLTDFLDATGSLQYRYPREDDCVAQGSVLLNDGTVITAAVIGQ